MRTPPVTRTWSIEGAEIVIRQSRPITADELFEHFDWRGMELADGFLVPKGAGISNEEKTLEFDLCARADANLEGYLAGYADYLPIVKTKSQKRLDVGYVVSSLSKLQSEHDEDLAKWFDLGYREVWNFWPWFRALYVHTSPSEDTRIRDIGFSSPYLTNRMQQWKLPLNEIFED